MKESPLPSSFSKRNRAIASNMPKSIISHLRFSLEKMKSRLETSLLKISKRKNQSHLKQKKYRDGSRIKNNCGKITVTLTLVIARSFREAEATKQSSITCHYTLDCFGLRPRNDRVWGVILANIDSFIDVWYHWLLWSMEKSYWQVNRLCPSVIFWSRITKICLLLFHALP